MKLEAMVGQKLMIGIPGARVGPAVLEIFRQTHAGGLILYRPNFASAEACRGLIADLEEKLGRKLIVAVDHEGGRVIHLAEGITVFPDNLALGVTKNVDHAARQGTIEALELRRLGIDLNLAPTLDVLTETFSPNIGIRSYGRDPELVAKLGAARIRAMQEAGLSACAKHFPGLGHSPLDPHLDLPVLAGTWESMRKIHLRPFLEAFGAGVDTVMSSHAVYPQLDAEKVPATFSKRILRDFLRKELGFSGVVLSDDLEMGALQSFGSIGDAACRAAQAGHDMLLVCHEARAQKEVFQSLLGRFKDKTLDLAELEKSVERIAILKRRRSERFLKGAPHPEPEGKSLAQKIAREAIRISTGELDLFPPPQPPPFFAEKKKEGEEAVAVIFPRLSALKDKIFIEDVLGDEEKFLEGHFARRGLPPPRIQIVGFDPSPEEFKRAKQLAEISALTVFFCYDAHLFPQTRRLLEVLQAIAKRCAVVLLRDPYDEVFLKKGTARVNAFGFRVCSLEALMEMVCASKMHASESKGDGL